MPYQSETIKTIVDRLNTQYFLPAIQRYYVWKPDQIIRLFDSVMQGYPISSFLFWEVASQNRDKWEIYKFTDHAHSDGACHKKHHAPYGIGHLTLVLDGQRAEVDIHADWPQRCLSYSQAKTSGGHSLELPCDGALPGPV